MKGAGRKHAACDMMPLNSASSVKHQQTGSRSSSQLGSGQSGTDTMFSVAGAIKSLANSFAEPPAGLKSAEHCKAAIEMLDKDDLSDNKQVHAIHIFSCHTSIVDTYLAITKKSKCTLHIQSKLMEAWLPAHYSWCSIYQSHAYHLFYISSCTS